MTYSDTEVRLVKIDGSWVRVSAVQAVVPTSSGRTGIWLSNGHRVDTYSTTSPDDVVDALFRRADQ